MEHLDAQLEALVIITIAGLLAMVPGLDRERLHRPAGLRTHMLIAMSAALITVMSRIIFDDAAASRMIANIITGVGFLGAGVIIKEREKVHDLTTAASIWSVAIMGIVVGYELYILATGMTIITGFVLTVLRRFENKVNESQAD